MTVRELIINLLEYPLNLDVYIGKGMGPLERFRVKNGVLIMEPKAGA